MLACLEDRLGLNAQGSKRQGKDAESKVMEEGIQLQTQGLGFTRANLCVAHARPLCPPPAPMAACPSGTIPDTPCTHALNPEVHCAVVLG